MTTTYVFESIRAHPSRRQTQIQLQKIRVPTLVLVGDSDILLPPEYSQIICQNIPNSELETIEDAGHLSNMGNSGIPFNETVLKFLKKVITT